MDDKFLRPAEVDLLVGDATKAKHRARVGEDRRLRRPGGHDGRRRRGAPPCAEPLSPRRRRRRRDDDVGRAQRARHHLGRPARAARGVRRRHAVVPVAVRAAARARLRVDGVGPVGHRDRGRARRATWRRCCGACSASSPASRSCSPPSVRRRRASAVSCSGTSVGSTSPPACSWWSSACGWSASARRARFLRERRFHPRAVAARGVGTPRARHGLRLRVDAVHRARPGRRPRAGRHPGHPGVGGRAARRLLARPGRAVPRHRARLRPAHLALCPRSDGACSSSTWSRVRPWWCSGCSC